MARLRAGEMQFTADIYRVPTGAFGTRGELIGSDKLLARGVPIGIRAISGREADQARARYPLVAYQAECRRDPALKLDELCYLHWLDRDRLLHIGYVDDTDKLNDVLLCGADLTEVPNGNS